MKLIVFLLFIISTQLFSYNKKVVETTLRSAAEEIITKSGFSLLSEDIQKEALAEQAAQTEDGDCIDDTCLMDTGKMLAAQRLFLIKVSELSKNQYMFKISHLNLETNETISVRSEVYNHDLNDITELFKFSKKFLSTISREVKKNKNREKIPVMLQVLFDTKLDEETKSDKNIKKHILTFKTKYDPVNIYEGKKFLGVTPLTIQLNEGIHTFTFEKKGYEAITRNIKVIRDFKISHLSFKKAIMLKITAKIDNATVYINRADAGTLENGVFEIGLKEGDYEVKISAEGYESKVKHIKFNENSKTLDFGEIYKINGPYPIKIKAGIKSKLFINNKFIAYTPAVVRLKKGTYTLNIYNEIAGNKTYKIHITKPTELYYKMNKGFKLIDFNISSMFLNTNFPWQKNSNHFFLGINTKLFTWLWKYFDIDILGIGFYHSLDRGILYKLHLFEFNFKPISNLKINVAIGPFLGDFLDYDNVQDLYRSFGGIKLGYYKIFGKYWYFNFETSAYYGTKNSEHSYYSTNDDSMDYGWLFSGSLNIGIFY